MLLKFYEMDRADEWHTTSETNFISNVAIQGKNLPRYRLGF